MQIPRHRHPRKRFRRLPITLLKTSIVSHFLELLPESNAGTFQSLPTLSVKNGSHALHRHRVAYTWFHHESFVRDRERATRLRRALLRTCVRARARISVYRIPSFIGTRFLDFVILAVVMRRDRSECLGRIDDEGENTIGRARNAKQNAKYIVYDSRNLTVLLDDITT